MADINIKLKNHKEAAEYLNETIITWKKFCPARLNKIKNHILNYPKKFNESYKFSFD
jgi:hypothetical protein